MKEHPFIVKKDTSGKKIDEKNKLLLEKFRKIKLNKSFYSKKKINIDNNSDIIQLRVILTFSYHNNSFEFFLPVLTTKDEVEGETKFDMRDIIKALFSSFGKDFTSKYTLSYYLNDDDEEDNQDDNNESENNFIENNTFVNQSYPFISNNSNDIVNNKTYLYFGEINLKENDDNDNDNEYFFNIPKDYTLYLKLRQKINKSNPLDLLYIDENKEYNEIFNNIDLDEKNEKNKEKSNLKGSGRDKEKTIGYSIKKLFMWQKIREKSESKITLVEASELVGMPKKTLDEYKNQIINGQKNGFNFSIHYKDKMNVLRTFNNNFNKNKIKKEDKNNS